MSNTKASTGTDGLSVALSRLLIAATIAILIGGMVEIFPMVMIDDKYQRLSL
jgi:hypothetical protein